MYRPKCSPTGAIYSANGHRRAIAVRARAMLEHSEFSVEEIAQRSGFGSTATLRHHFSQRFFISPGRYRKNFA